MRGTARMEARERVSSASCVVSRRSESSTFAFPGSAYERSYASRGTEATSRAGLQGPPSLVRQKRAKCVRGIHFWRCSDARYINCKIRWDASFFKTFCPCHNPTGGGGSFLESDLGQRQNFSNKYKFLNSFDLSVVFQFCDKRLRKILKIGKFIKTIRKS